MTTLDWHGERAGLADLRLLDRCEEPEGIDLDAVRRYRLDRVRAEMAGRDISACLLFDPVNIRYATGSRNMQVFSQRNPSRYLLLPVEGPAILFEFAGCMHLADGLDTIDEVRPAITASFVAAGPGIADRERQWARETAAILREFCGTDARIGIERVNAGATATLAAEASAWSTPKSRWRGRARSNHRGRSPAFGNPSRQRKLPSVACAPRSGRVLPRLSCGRCCTRRSLPRAAIMSRPGC